MRGVVKNAAISKSLTKELATESAADYRPDE